MAIKSLIRLFEGVPGLTREALLEAEAARADESLMDTLVRKKLARESQLLTCLQEASGLDFVPHLNLTPAPAEFTRDIPIHFLKRHTMVPLGKGEDAIPTIAINGLDSLQAVDDLARILGFRRHGIILSTKDEITSAINTLYDQKNDDAQQIVDDMEGDETIIHQLNTQAKDLLDDTSDAPIIKLVNHIISQSVKAKASDIHIEPGAEQVKVRYRIDGILYDLLESPKWSQSALTTRIKVMADMDIAEKRLPQDSRIELRMGNRDIDIRISTIPTALGERIVMRLLDKSGTLLALPEFGLDPERLGQIRHLAGLPNGIVLMTGPTGSGKTTSLYAILSEINRPDINIITVEDPVEYKLKGISQIQVNGKIGLTFAKSLRSIVRQDPDVILIGEIRDQETASIAVQSALTGHLVLSTLHTNDAASAITRLVDIGIEPFLISSAVRAVMAQRLIRLLCPECKEAYTPEASALAPLGLTPKDCKGHTLYRAKGCPACFKTGYKGRMPIFEILPITDTQKALILATSDAGKIRKAAVEDEMITLLQDGIQKIFSGLTTIEEVLRVTQG